MTGVAIGAWQAEIGAWQAEIGAWYAANFRKINIINNFLLT